MFTKQYLIQLPISFLSFFPSFHLSLHIIYALWRNRRYTFLELQKTRRPNSGKAIHTPPSGRMHGFDTPFVRKSPNQGMRGVWGSSNVSIWRLIVRRTQDKPNFDLSYQKAAVELDLIKTG